MSPDRDAGRRLSAAIPGDTPGQPPWRGRRRRDQPASANLRYPRPHADV